MGRLGARAAAAVWLVGAAVYLVSEAIAAASFPGYSYIADYISDLGISAVMNIGAFMLHGSLFLVGAIIISRSCPTLGLAGWSFVFAAAANAIGNILVGTFRSGAVDGRWCITLARDRRRNGDSRRQHRGDHRRTRQWPIGRITKLSLRECRIGVVGIACLLALIIDGANGSRLPAGAVERGSVYSIIVWEIMTGLAILLRFRRDFER